MFRFILYSTLLFILFYSADSTLISAVEEFDFPSFKNSPEIGFTVEILKKPILDLEFADFNNDGLMDMVTYYQMRVRDVRYFSFRTLDNQVIQEEPLENPVGGMKAVDINQDAYPELIYYSLHGFRGYLNIYFVAEDSTITIPVATGVDVFPNGEWDSFMTDAKLLRRSTGERWLVFALSTGRDYYPRGIYALDLQTYQLKWKFEIGGRPQNKLLIQDLNQDGRQEILFSTFAPDNHVTQNGYSDSTSYFFVLDEDGKAVWHYSFCNGISYCLFAYRPDSNDVLIFGYSKEAKRKPPPMSQFSLSDFTLVKTIEGEYQRIGDVYISEKLHPSIMNTIIGNGEWFPFASHWGYVRIFDRKFQETCKLNFHHPVRYAFHIDLNQDGKNEWLVILNPSSEVGCKAIILDSKYRIIGYKDLPKLTDVHFDPDSLKRETRVLFQDDDTRKLQAWVVPWGEIVSPSSLAYHWKKSRDEVLYFLTAASILAILGILVQNIRKQSFKSQKLGRIANYFLNNPVDAHLIINNHGVIEEHTPAFATMFQLPSRHIKNVRFEQLLTEGEYRDLHNLIKKSLQEMELNSTAHEIVTFVQNGFYRKLGVSISKVEIRKKEFILLLEFSDLSKIAKSDRVASWASMASNMAHEIKNPLMTITLSLGRLEKKLLKDAEEQQPEEEKYIDFIRDEVKKMRNTVNQFMRFTSSLEFHFENYHLNRLITEVVDLYRKRESQRITFGLDMEEELPPVWIDVEQTRNVLVNIFDNAIDAIGGEGEITISATEIEQVRGQSGRIQKRIEIQISDTGMGIATEHLGKVFEPNFTTKSTGAGFGLSIARHVMEEQGGEISISSTQDIGTTVTLLFPAGSSS